MPTQQEQPSIVNFSTKIPCIHTLYKRHFLHLQNLSNHCKDRKSNLQPPFSFNKLDQSSVPWRLIGLNRHADVSTKSGTFTRAMKMARIPVQWMENDSNGLRVCSVFWGESEFSCEVADCSPRNIDIYIYIDIIIHCFYRAMINIVYSTSEKAPHHLRTSNPLKSKKNKKKQKTTPFFRYYARFRDLQTLENEVCDKSE